MIMKGSVEEKILEMQRRKSNTTSATIDNMSKTDVFRITIEDLKSLLV